MILLSNSVAQTVSPGQPLAFGTVPVKTGCDTSHRAGSGTVTLKGKCAVYEVQFSANISGTAAGPVQLAIALDGEVLPETTMISTVTTAADPNSVSTSTLVRTDGCCCGRIAVVNTGTADVVVSANPSFIVKRVC